MKITESMSFKILKYILIGVFMMTGIKIGMMIMNIPSIFALVGGGIVSILSVGVPFELILRNIDKKKKNEK